MDELKDICKEELIQKLAKLFDSKSLDLSEIKKLLSTYYNEVQPNWAKILHAIKSTADPSINEIPDNKEISD